MTALLLVGTDDGLYAIEDTYREQRLPGHPVTALAHASDDGLLAILSRRFVTRSPDGVEWREIIEFSGVEPACLLDTDHALWIGTHPPHLYRWTEDRLERIESFEDVPGKETWYTPWGGPPETRSLAITPDGTLFANVHVGGIPRSRGGAPWEPTIDVRADVHQVLVHPDDPGLILAASARGLAISQNAGDSWEVHRDGLHGHYMSAVAVVGRTAFVTSSTGSSSNARSAIYRFDLDRQGSFERCGEGLPEWITGNVNTYCLDVAGGQIAFGAPDGHVYAARTDDLAWRIAATHLPPVRCVLWFDA
jgi:hypothetical protein